MEITIEDKNAEIAERKAEEERLEVERQ